MRGGHWNDLANAGDKPGAGEGRILRPNLSETAGAGASGLSLNIEGLHETGDGSDRGRA